MGMVFTEILAKIDRAAVNGQKLHLDIEHVRALATSPVYASIAEMHRRGVPEAQIDAAAGHVGEGTGKRNYRHVRPDYLAEFIAGVEAFWAEISRYTDVHLRSHGGPKIASIATARAKARTKTKE